MKKEILVFTCIISLTFAGAEVKAKGISVGRRVKARQTTTFLGMLDRSKRRCLRFSLMQNCLSNEKWYRQEGAWQLTSCVEKNQAHTNPSVLKGIRLLVREMSGNHQVHNGKSKEVMWQQASFVGEPYSPEHLKGNEACMEECFQPSGH